MDDPYAFGAGLGTIGWQTVDSSAIAAVRYDPALHELRIRFHKGTKQGRIIYCYFGVPERVFREFLSSSSKGRYHALLIKDHYGGRWE